MLYSKNCHNWFHITHVFQTFFIRSVQTWQNLKVTQNCKVLIVKNSKSDKFLILDKLIFQTTQKFANCAFNQFPLYSMLHYCKTVVSWILMSYVSISWKRVTFLFISILVAREDDSYYYLVFFKKITKNRIFSITWHHWFWVTTSLSDDMTKDSIFTKISSNWAVWR